MLLSIVGLLSHIQYLVFTYSHTLQSEQSQRSELVCACRPRISVTCQFLLIEVIKSVGWYPAQFKGVERDTTTFIVCILVTDGFILAALAAT
jgi:hypothetical protein